MIVIIQDRITGEWDLCIERGGLQYVMSTHPTPFEAQSAAAAYLPADQRAEFRGRNVDLTA